MGRSREALEARKKKQSARVCETKSLDLHSLLLYSFIGALSTDGIEVRLLDVVCLAGFLVVETEAIVGSVGRRVH